MSLNLIIRIIVCAIMTTFYTLFINIPSTWEAITLWLLTFIVSLIGSQFANMFLPWLKNHKSDNDMS